MLKKKTRSAGEGGMRQNHFANLLVIAIYSKVASNILPFSISLSFEWPYNRRFAKFVIPRNRQRFFLWRMVSMVSKSAPLWIEYRGQDIKKWWLSSTPLPQMQFAEGVSRNLWRFLWCRRWLRPSLSWKICLRSGWWIRKVDLISGR